MWMEYKKHFTQEELAALLAWFDKRMDELPPSLCVDHGSTYIKDLKSLVDLYGDIIKDHQDNPTYSGQIYLLYKIKDALESKEN